ncbi:MAG: hypothetical protein ACK53Y_20225, partial [bacterium]
MNPLKYVGKELTVQVTSKRSCIRSSILCGTNWACEETTWGPKPYPPHPTSPFVSDPLSGVQEDRGGKGRSRCWSSPVSWTRPHSLTALTLQICQMPLSYLMGHPSVESTPLSEPWIQRLTCPPLKQRSLGGGWGEKGGG